MTISFFAMLLYILGAGYGLNCYIMYQKIRVLLVTQGCHNDLCGGPHFLIQI